MQSEEAAYVERDRAAAQAAEDQQRAAATQAKFNDRVSTERIKLGSYARERELEAQGIQHEKDPAGRTVVKNDPLTGKPKMTDLKGPMQYDATGRAYQMKREAGELKQDFPDADAKIDRNPNDPTDKLLYRQNKLKKWDAIDPEQALQDPDPKLRATAASHLMDLEKTELEREKTTLAIDLRNPDYDGITPSAIAKARERVAGGYPEANDARLLAKAEEIANKKRRQTEIDRRTLEMGTTSPEAYAQSRIGKMDPRKADESRVGILGQRFEAVKAIRAEIDTEEQALQAEKDAFAPRMQSFRADEEAGIREQLGRFQLRDQMLNQKKATLNQSITEVNTFQESIQKRRAEAESAKAAALPPNPTAKPDATPQTLQDAITAAQSKTVPWAKTMAGQREKLGYVKQEGTMPKTAAAMERWQGVLESLDPENDPAHANALQTAMSTAGAEIAAAEQEDRTAAAAKRDQAQKDAEYLQNLYQGAAFGGTSYSADSPEQEASAKEWGDVNFLNDQDAKSYYASWGELAINPKFIFRPDLYAEAVQKSKAPPFAKERAMQALAPMQGQAAAPVFRGFQEAAATQNAFLNSVKATSKRLGVPISQYSDPALQSKAVEDFMANPDFSDNWYQVALGASRGMDQLQQQMAGVGSFFGSADAQKYGEKMLERQGDASAAAEAGGGSDMLGQVVSGATSLIPSIGAGVLTGGAGFGAPAALAAGSVAAGLQSGGSTMIEARKAGMSQLGAMGVAATSALVTGLITRAGGSTGAEAVFKKLFAEKATMEAIKPAFKQVLVDKLKGYGIEGLKEVAEEVPDQFVQNLLAGATYKPGQDVTEGLFDTAVVSFILGGGMNAATDVAASGANRLNAQTLIRDFGVRMELGKRLAAETTPETIAGIVQESPMADKAQGFMEQLALVDARIADGEEQLALAAKPAATLYSTKQLAQAYGDRLKLVQQIAQGLKSSFKEAAFAEIDAAQAPQQDPAMGMASLTPRATEMFEQDKARSKALVAIAAGEAESLDNATLALVDLARDDKGMIGPAKGKTNAPDGQPRVTVENGQLVIGQGTIDRLTTAFPSTAPLIGKSETERRAEVTTAAETDKKTDKKPAATAKPAGPEPAAKPTKGTKPAPAAVPETEAAPGAFLVEVEGLVDPVRIEANDAGEAEAVARVAHPGKIIGKVTTLYAPKPAAKPQAKAPKSEAAPDPDAEPKADKGTFAGRIPAEKLTPANIAQQLYAVASASGKVDDAKRKRYVSAGRAIAAELERWKAAFPAGVYVIQGSDGGGFEVDRKKRPQSLSLDFARMVESLDELAKGGESLQWVSRVIQEEAIHSATMNLELDGQLDLAALYRSLPAKMRSQIAAAYNGPQSDVNLGYEFMRMWVQQRIFDKKPRKGQAALTEQTFPPDSLAKIKEALSALLRYFRNLAGALQKQKASEETIERVKEAGDMIEAAVMKLETGAKAAPPSSAIATTAAEVQGDPISKEWTAFAEDSGSLGIPRADMPQIKTEHRGALAQFLKARGIDWTFAGALPGSLKPTQAEFSPAKVKKAAEWMAKNPNGTRDIMVSRDRHVVDGHHQWMEALQNRPGEQMGVFALDASIEEILELMKEFPSATKADGSAYAAPEGDPEGKYSVYPLQRQDGLKWMVQAGAKRGFGDWIFETEAEARTQAKREQDSDESRAASLAGIAQKEKDDAAKKEAAESLGGFEEGMTPMQKGAARKALSSNRNYKGKLITRRDMIRQFVEEGRFVATEDGVRRLVNAEGGFFGQDVLSKTGLDYAEWLIAQDAISPSNADVPEPDFGNMPDPTVAKNATVPPDGNWRLDGFWIRPKGVGKKWSRAEQESMEKAFQEAGFPTTRLAKSDDVYSVRQEDKPVGAGFRIKENVSPIRDAIAAREAERAAATKAEKAKEASDKAAKVAEETDPDARDWILATFGADTMNAHNMRALARFLTGEAPSFEGMINPKWVEGVQKVGAIDGDKVNWAKLKDAYQAASAPAPAPGPKVETSPVGLIYSENGVVYADSRSLQIAGTIPGFNVDHIGGGDFDVKTPAGTVAFNRLDDGTPEEGQSGRLHALSGKPEALQAFMDALRDKGALGRPAAAPAPAPAPAPEESSATALSPEVQAMKDLLADIMDGTIQSQPVNQSYGRDIPDSIFPIFISSVKGLIRSGIDTPQKLGEALTSMGPAFRSFSEAVWSGFGVTSGAFRAIRPDWDAIYAAMDKPAAPRLSYEEFAQQYEAAFKSAGKYTPNQVGSREYTDRMAALADEFPEYMERFDAGIDTPAAPEETTDPIRDLILSDEPRIKKAMTMKKLSVARGETVKQTQEFVEARLVQISDQIARGPGTPQEKFAEMVRIYDKQPLFSARTSTSMENQAYSTPVPMAYVLGHMTGVTPQSTVYDGTAGNGMLEIGADLENSVANELDATRRQGLTSLGVGTITDKDATQAGAFPVGHPKVDIVHLNPPFGPFPNVNYKGYGMKKLEHIITVRALDEAMKDNGTAAIIMGATMNQQETSKGAQWVFENFLYGHYNVVDNFEASGDLYGNQGAKWPVRIIVLAGKRANPVKADLAPKSVDRLDTWEDVWARAERTRNEVERQRNSLGTGGQPPVSGDSTEGTTQPDDEGAVSGGERPTAGTAPGGRGPRGNRPRKPNPPKSSGNGNPGLAPPGLVPEPQNPAPAPQPPVGGGKPDPRVENGGGRRPEGSTGGTGDSAAGSGGPQSGNGPAADAGGLTPAQQRLAALRDRIKGGSIQSAPLEQRYSTDIPRAEAAELRDIAESLLFDDGIDTPALLAATLQQLGMQEFSENVWSGIRALKASLPATVNWSDTYRTLKPAKPPTPPAPPRNDNRKKAAATETQIPYDPESTGNPFETLIPRGIGESVRTALEEITANRGPIDEFVARELDMSVEDLHKAMSAEQVDGVAMAIYQMETGGALIIGDETGIGKGRQAASLIRYAVRKGKIPVFFTKDPKLFSDMWGDLKDINTPVAGPNASATDLSVRPLIFGAQDTARIVTPEGALVLKPATLPQQRNIFARAKEEGFAQQGYNAIFSTYSQINKQNDRQAFLEWLADNDDVVIVLDEAHESAGDGETSMQAAFMMGGTVTKGSGPEAVQILKSGLLNGKGAMHPRGGALYLSATFAKRPDNMPVYFRTDLRKAGQDIEQVVNAMKNGGVALQQAVTEALAEAGQYTRRERDFTGVSYSMKRVQVADEAELIRQVNEVTEVLSAISDFSSTISASVATSTALTGNQQSMTEFASIVHNQVGQLLLAAKADAVVDEVIAAKARGEKPIVALMNTMESFLSQYIGDMNIKVGDPVKLSWSELLQYALSRTLRISEKMPDGSTQISTIDPDEFGLGQYFNEAMESAKDVAVTFPVSPIDYIIQKAEQAGVKMGELTGRQSGIQYTDFATGAGTYKTFKKANKNTLVNGFNGGTLDGMLLNASGSTGLSIHASEKFKDQQPRHMIIAQPALDINVFIQTLGRIKRTGIVMNGRYPDGSAYGARYSHLTLPLNAELRPAVMAARKMKSLNANTTGESDSAVKIEAEDLMNRFGNRAVAEYLNRNPGLARALDLKIDENEEGEVTVPADVARKFTGRMSLRPDAEQGAAYAEIIADYRRAIEQAKVTGDYDLEIIVHDDWDGVQLGKGEQIVPGTDESSIFTASVNVQPWEITDNRPTPSGAEMLKEFQKEHGSAEAAQLQWAKFSKQVDDRLDKIITDQTERLGNAIEELDGMNEEDPAYKGQQFAVSQLTRMLAATNKKAKTWEATKPRMDDVLDRAGQVVQIEQTETKELDQGMLTQIKYPDITKDLRIAPSAFKFTYLLDRPGGRIYPSLAQFKSTGYVQSSSNYDIEDLEGDRGGKRETRTIIVGNPVRAYAATGGKGKVVRFKSRDGEIVTGLMMPRNWSIKKLADDPRLELTGGDSVARYFTNMGWGSGYLESGQNIRLQKGNGFKLSSPAARRTGGDIFLDDQLREIVGDFNRVGSRMVAMVYSEDIARVAERVTQITGKRFRGEDLNLVRNANGADSAANNTPAAKGRPKSAVKESATKAWNDHIEGGSIQSQRPSRASRQQTAEQAPAAPAAPAPAPAAAPAAPAVLLSIGNDGSIVRSPLDPSPEQLESQQQFARKLAKLVGCLNGKLKAS